MRNTRETREFPSVHQMKVASGVNFKIIVPSTRDKNKKIDRLAFAKRVRGVNQFIANRFRGSTVQRAVGNYLYRGKVIKEDVVIVSVFTNQETYNYYDEELRNFLKSKKKSWGQDSMGFEYKEKLYFV